MKVRAVVFDIYKTLLQVTPGPADGEARWTALWEHCGRNKPPMQLGEFDRKAGEFIVAENDAARERGVAFPEVFWPQIARAALPELKSFSEQALDDFLYQHAQLQRGVSLLPDAAKLLHELVQSETILGLCSNCQPYTLRELGDALHKHGLGMEIFRRPLCFFSFEARFSKPDPAVFLRLANALSAHGIALNEALLVGDRHDNDILPAQTQGWQTWHLGGPASEQGGDWRALSACLSAATSG